MVQQNLFGEDVEVAKELDQERKYELANREFVELQIKELTEMRDMIIADELPLVDEDGDMSFELKKVLGAWWYCNHIVGWDNNVPIDRDEFTWEYNDLPMNDLMANHIRDCWLSVDRDGVRWDKDYAIRRLNKAIEDYTGELK